MTRGAIYIVHGDKYIAEALTSAASLKRAMPELPITLFCDQPVGSASVDSVVRIAADDRFPGCASKIPHLSASPYRETLFLDSDTYVYDQLDPLFDVLRAFDLAAAHSTSRAIYEVAAPDSFPEFNTGVIVYRDSTDVGELFLDWRDRFIEYMRRLSDGTIRWYRPPDQRFHVLNDQGVFREAVFHSRLRVATLPPEYNCRFNDPGFVEGVVRVLHGRSIELSKAAGDINARTIRRGYEQRGGRIRLQHFYEPSDNPYRIESIRYMCRRQGILWTAKAALRRIGSRGWFRRD